MPREPLQEEPKRNVSTHWLDFLKWHIPTAFAVTTTGILLWLDFGQYAIGNTAQDSANALGALQLTIKIHELFIVTSLVTIARQMIIGNFMKNGIVLGRIRFHGTDVHLVGRVRTIAGIWIPGHLQGPETSQGDDREYSAYPVSLPYPGWWRHLRAQRVVY